MPEFSAHDVHRHRRRRRTRQRLRQRLRPVLRLPLRSRDGSVPLDRSKTSKSDSHSISLKIRTHGTVPRAVHNSRGTGGDQDGHLLVQHVPRPLRARPVRGHYDRLRREGLEDVSGKKSAKVGREEIDPITVSSFISDILFGTDIPPLAPLLHHARVSSLAHREQTIRRGEGHCHKGCEN